MAVFVGYWPAKPGEPPRWDHFEAPHDCLADLHDAMQAGFVQIDLLRTRRVDHAEREIVNRRPMLLGPRLFVAIENCTLKITED